MNGHKVVFGGEKQRRRNKLFVKLFEKFASRQELCKDDDSMLMFGLTVFAAVSTENGLRFKTVLVD